MKKNYSLIILSFIISITTNAQTICGIVNEGQNLTLTAPVGQVITSINFASYGTPTGTCASNNLVISGCHSNTSRSQVEALALGKNSFTIAATNTVFGDPCGGTVKKLAVIAGYGVLANTTFSINSKISMYPNPAQSIVTVSYKSLSSANLEIMDSVGRLVSINKLNENTTEIDISNLSNGTYLFKITSEEGIGVNRIIKN
ncbi:T9SS type A sorting domain-containing protein [Flavobacterium sp.]|uniref:T9SS type A sorting domain-containing protein n=1 Tax=Flavobacterium sp. TaxID=239 RepID=UPI003753AA64